MMSNELFIRNFCHETMRCKKRRVFSIFNAFDLGKKQFNDKLAKIVHLNPI